jgi:hypothetical protein
MVLQSATCHRVAKNPLKYALVEALSFKELQALSRPGCKRMFCPRALTVHFPLTAPGTPFYALQAREGTHILQNKPFKSV